MTRGLLTIGFVLLLGLFTISRVGSALPPNQAKGIKWATAWNKAHPKPLQIIAVGCISEPPKGTIGCKVIFAQAGKAARCEGFYVISPENKILLTVKIICAKPSQGAI